MNVSVSLVVDIDIFALYYTPEPALIYIFNILSINLRMPISKPHIIYQSLSPLLPKTALSSNG